MDQLACSHPGRAVGCWSVVVAVLVAACDPVMSSVDGPLADAPPSGDASDASAADFAISVDPGRVIVTPGGTTVVRVNIVRGAGFAGDVTLSLGANPAALTIEAGALIAAGTSQTDLTLATPATAAQALTTTEIVGTAVSRVHVAPLATLVRGRPGALDISFGQGGVVVVDTPGALVAGAIAPDGKIVAVGGTGALIARRFNADGTADDGFAVAGALAAPGFAQNASGAVALGAGGRVLLGGDYYQGGAGGAAVVAATPTGQVDDTFGAAGRVAFQPADFSALVHGMVANGGGALVVVGSNVNEGGAYPFLSLLADDGSTVRDVSVTPAGCLFPGGSSAGNAVAVATGGGVVLVGSCDRGAGDLDVLLTRHTGALALDTTQLTGGVLIVGGAGYQSGRDLVQYPDGRVLIVGGAGPTATASRFSLRRVLASGMPDGAFGTSGLTSTSFDLASAEATGVAAQPDGALVVVGTASGPGASHVVVARYLASGVLDLGFGDHGSVFPGSGTHVEAADVVLDADGRCVVIGTSDGKPFLARLWL